MKGIIFTLLEEVVAEEHGEAAWDAVLAASGLEGAYTSLGSYPDADFSALVAAAAGRRGERPQQTLRWFGRRALPRLARRFPGFFRGHGDARSFVLSLGRIVHPEVRKVYPGSVTPAFEMGDGPDGEVLMRYRSPRRLCGLAEGFLDGAAAHFRERVRVDHRACLLRGDDHCLLALRFEPQAAQA